MPKQRDDADVQAGADVADVLDDPEVESGAGGRDSAADVGAVVYSDRREFLIACMIDKRNRYVAWFSDDEWYGLANTEHQFRKALAETLFDVEKLGREDLHRLFVEEWKEGVK